MHVLYYLLLLALLLIGWFVNILGVPGLWLMVGAFGLYAVVTGWETYVGWPALLAMVLLAAGAEVVEFLAGAAGSAAAGGRKRGMIGAIVGGFLGAIFLSVIPIPVVAQVVGACLGAFIGAALMEFTDKDVAHSFRVGVGAAKGRFWGIVSKLGFGLIMFFLAAVTALPYGAATITPPPAPSPSTIPTTTPSTPPTTTDTLPSPPAATQP
jgi:uncharacterized protein YqgC (DUF456 family)